MMLAELPLLIADKVLAVGDGALRLAVSAYVVAGLADHLGLQARGFYPAAPDADGLPG